MSKNDFDTALSSDKPNLGALKRATGEMMDKKSFFDDIQSRVNQILENSPAKDIEKNVRAMLTQAFAKLDLVTREEFDAQALMLAQLRERLDALEKRIAAQESGVKTTDEPSPSI